MDFANNFFICIHNNVFYLKVLNCLPLSPLTSAKPALCGELQQCVGKGICCSSKEVEAT